MMPARTFGSIPSAVPRFIASATPIIEMPSKHVIADLRDLAVARRAAMHDVLAHMAEESV